MAETNTILYNNSSSIKRKKKGKKIKRKKKKVNLFLYEWQMVKEIPHI